MMHFLDFVYYLGFDDVPTVLHQDFKLAAESDPNFELCIDAVCQLIDGINRKSKSEILIVSCAYFVTSGVGHNQFIVQKVKTKNS